MQYRGEERTTELSLTQDMIGRLAFEAAFRNVQIGELIGELIVGLLKEDLLQLVSVRDSFRGAGRVAASHSRQEQSIASREVCSKLFSSTC